MSVPRVCRGPQRAWDAGREASGTWEARQVPTEGRPWRTARPKLRAALERFTPWCREKRHRRLSGLCPELNGKRRGDYQYYGVHGNSASLKQFLDGALRILLKWLTRRSQRRSYNWQSFTDILEHFKGERPRISAHRKTRKATARA